MWCLLERLEGLVLLEAGRKVLGSHSLLRADARPVGGKPLGDHEYNVAFLAVQPSGWSHTSCKAMPMPLRQGSRIQMRATRGRQSRI